MRPPPLLATERLVLRPREPADADAVFAAAADPDLVRWLPPGARGAGYAAEALAALAAWGFGELALERIELHTAECNAASQRTALRAGFRSEGRQRRGCRCDGEQQDMLVFARLRDDPSGPMPRLLPDVDSLTDGVVVLRPMQPGDAAAWHAERIDPDAIRWSAGLDPPDLEETRRRAGGVAARWLAGTEARFAIIDGGEYAGHICLRMTEPEIGIGELGYALVPAHRGRGLMRRALRLVGAWALTDVGLHRVEAGVGVANAASQRTAEAAGFRREGILRKALPGPDGRYDIVLFSLLPEDLSCD